MNIIRRLFQRKSKSQVKNVAPVNRKPTIINLCGNIASGKTTCLQKVSERFGPEVVFIQEPLRTWQQIFMENDLSLFENYCRDPRHYAFQFQALAMFSRVEQILKHPNARVIVVERLPIDDWYQYVQIHRERGNLTPDDVIILGYIAQVCMELIGTVVHTIYLDVPVKACLQRCKSRNRPGEEFIDGDYLKRLELGILDTLEDHKKLANTTSGQRAKLTVIPFSFCHTVDLVETCIRPYLS